MTNHSLPHLAHDLKRLPNGEWPDPVKRIKDEMDYHAVMHERGFVAIKLEDGSPLDHTAYPTWNDAVKAAKWDRDSYVFLEIQPDGMPYNEAAAVLDYARKLYAGGYRIPSPEWDNHQASAMPRTAFDRKRAARQLITGKPLYPPGVPYSNLPNKKGH
jgi:hypothetical protein